MAGNRRLDRLSIGVMLVVAGLYVSWSGEVRAGCVANGSAQPPVLRGMHDCTVDKQAIAALTQTRGGSVEVAQGDTRTLALLGIPWALRNQEREHDDNAVIRESIARYRELLQARYTLEQAPQMWAQTQHDLGRALQLLAEDRMLQVARDLKIERRRGIDEKVGSDLREYLSRSTTLVSEIDLKPLIGGHEDARQTSAAETRKAYEHIEVQLNAAVVAYRNALKVWTRERHPFHWALTQRNIGTALFTLGEPLMNLELISAAVTAYENALQVWTRDRQPLYWARTQFDLGTALWAYLPTDMVHWESPHIEAASAAFANALQEWTLERDPFNHIWAQEGLAITLGTTGFVHGNVEDVQAAKAGLRDAYAKLQTIGNAQDDDLDRYRMRVRSVQYMLDAVLAGQADRAKKRWDTWPSPRSTD